MTKHGRTVLLVLRLVMAVHASEADSLPVFAGPNVLRRAMAHPTFETRRSNYRLISTHVSSPSSTVDSFSSSESMSSSFSVDS